MTSSAWSRGEEQDKARAEKSQETHTEDFVATVRILTLTLSGGEPQQALEQRKGMI